MNHEEPARSASDLSRIAEGLWHSFGTRAVEIAYQQAHFSKGMTRATWLNLAGRIEGMERAAQNDRDDAA